MRAKDLRRVAHTVTGQRARSGGVFWHALAPMPAHLSSLATAPPLGGWGQLRKWGLVLAIVSACDSGAATSMDAATVSAPAPDAASMLDAVATPAPAPTRDAAPMPMPAPDAPTGLPPDAPGSRTLDAPTAPPPDAPSSSPPDAPTGAVSYQDLSPVREVDILVMVDNSPSMLEEQANLARNFPAFIKRLQAIPGGLPDIRIAVVTSDMGAGGNTVGGNCLGYGDGARFQVNSITSGQNCGLMGDAKYLIASDRGTQTNLQPGKTLEDVFACMATRGGRGCGYEHQLQAVRVGLLALPGINLENRGFLRPNAYLAILMLTDEDDCSAPPSQLSFDFFVSDNKGQTPSLRCNTDGHLCNGKPISLDPMMSTPLAECGPNPTPSKLIKVEELIATIKSLKRPDRIAVAGIFGVPLPGTEARARYSVYANPRLMNDLQISPACSTPGLGVADPGLRLKQFVDAFAPNSSVHSICNEDFTPALDAIGKLVADRVGSICVSLPLVDADPTTPELNPDCQVNDQSPVGNMVVDVPISQCNDGKTNRPCWSITPDAANCVASGFKIEVFRADGMTSPPNSKVAINCRACTLPADPRCKQK